MTQFTIPEAERDRIFNPWRTTANPQVDALCTTVASMLQDYEEHWQLRQRPRRQRDKEIMHATVRSLVCDALHRHLTTPDGEGRIMVSMSNAVRKSRYRHEIEGKQLPTIVSRLCSDGLRVLEIDELGEFVTRRMTAIKAGKFLRGVFRHYDFEQEDLILEPGQEIVILKQAKERLNKDTASDRSLWMEYRDTSTTRRYRAEVKRINENLIAADLEYRGGRLIDRTDRVLRRYFNNAKFDEGGRLFGGFWQQLKSRQRRLIRIESEEVVTLDFDTMIARLAYAEMDLRLPAGDGYDIEGFTAGDRAGIKRLFSSMLFAQKPLKGWPRQVRELFPEGTRLKDAVTAIQRAHPELDPLWFSGTGHRLMFTESEIMVAVLLELLDNQVTALPIHDAIVVPAVLADYASGVMLEKFEETTGQPASVSSR
ncbi:hypothetical protein [Lentisalinibacter salinarum]|uniref:hypothetical protein n=1 Tax=Lentisalinibacter salinarum TaxID=2992239 RepID=UPI0038707E0A